MKLDDIEGIKLLSNGKDVIAQSQIGEYTAENVIDGRKDTYWMASPYYQWLKLDLGNGYPVNRIQLDFGRDRNRYYHYYMEYSMDNLNWELAIEKVDNTISDTDEIDYDVSFHARYIRITMTYCSLAMNVKIYNINIYGYENNVSFDNRLCCVGWKVPAVNCDVSEGFECIEVSDTEDGWPAHVMATQFAGSYIHLKQVDFANHRIDQFRGSFGFPSKDREKLIRVEIRLDRIDGEIIGTMDIFRQYTPWTILACDIKREDNTLVQGVHDVYFVLTRVDAPQTLMVHWLSFVKKSPLPQPIQKPKSIPLSEDGEYEVYFGNLHSHTAFSDGTAVPEYAYDYARYKAGLDFLAITEHSNLYDETFDFDKSRKWADLKRFAMEKTEDGAFLALIGSETTWYNQFGHMNTYNIDFYLNTYELKYNDVSNYYNTVKQYPNSINQWNHPWSCGNRHLDNFEPYDKNLDQVLYMVEINHLESPEQGGLSYYISALDKGWHVSPAGNQDNHNDQWGTQNHLRTAVLMEKLTTKHLYDAIQNYRVYFTCAVHLKVWFWVNGAIMGSRTKSSDEYFIRIKAGNQLNESPIVKAEIIGERGVVRNTIHFEGHDVEATVTLTGNERYYFLKVYQANDEFAATSPVWIEG